jgi:hypothetical protein
MAKITGHIIVSANHLLTGATIYLTASGWSVNIRDAQTAEAQEADALLARARAQGHVAVGPAVSAVTLGPDGPAPARRRERMRRDGPGVGALNPDLCARHGARADAA